MGEKKRKWSLADTKDTIISLGMVLLITFGWNLWQAQMELKDYQIEVLKMTQYDNALVLINSQRELHEMELQTLRDSITLVSRYSPLYADSLRKRVEVVDGSLKHWNSISDGLWPGTDGVCDPTATNCIVIISGERTASTPYIP